MVKLERGTKVFYSKTSKITYLVPKRGHTVQFIMPDGQTGETVMIGYNQRVIGQGYDNAKQQTLSTSKRRKLARQLIARG